jgi:hypothetical protein
MARALTRTNFNSSRLIRVLADLAMVDTAGSGSAFAEKLGLWVGFTDAITLRAAHDSGLQSLSDMPSGQSSVARQAVAEEFTQVRTSLVQSIVHIHSANGPRTRIALPSPKVGVSYDDAIAYEPYRRYHRAHQRDMELQVRPLRTKVREVLANASPALKQLAELDAAFDGILSERESKLLSTLPSLLEKRFKQLQKAHQLTHVDSQTADAPDLWMKPGGWLARFCGELQAVLVAELDIRLQPVEGLIEALKNNIENQV